MYFSYVSGYTFFKRPFPLSDCDCDCDCESDFANNWVLVISMKNQRKISRSLSQWLSVNDIKLVVTVPVVDYQVMYFCVISQKMMKHLHFGYYPDKRKIVRIHVHLSYNVIKIPCKYDVVDTDATQRSLYSV